MSEENPFSKPQQEKSNVSFDIPVESVPLPSKGIIYPMGSPLCNEEALDIKAMTAKEEDLLTSRALIKNGTVISQLLKSCILNKTIDPDEMLAGDRNAVLVGIRVTGYGSKYDVKITCPECSHEFANSFSLDRLEIKRLGAQPLRSNLNLFEFVLPVSGAVIHFKLLTGKDESEISKILEAKRKLNSQIENSVTTRLLQAIVSVNGESDRNIVAKFVNNMRAADARALRNFMDEIEPGVNMKQHISCPECLAQSEVNMPLGMTFFWPDL